MSIRQCHRAVVDLDRIVLAKHKLTLRDFKPKTDFNIELAVGVTEFGEDYVCNALCHAQF